MHGGRQSKPRGEFLFRTAAPGIAAVAFTAFFPEPIYGLLRRKTSETRLSLPGIPEITVTEEYHDVLVQLDEYIRSNYMQGKVLGKYEIW